MSRTSSVAPLTVTLAAACALFAANVLADTPRVSPPIVHENVSIYLLRGTSRSGPVPKTLAEALEANAVEVHETGNVRELKIENKGDDPLFIQMGDIVKGGRQDRVLTVSLLLPPRSGLLPVGAYCVEQGRWSARGVEDVKRFAMSAALLPSREAKMAIAKPAGAIELRVEGAPRQPARTPIEGELNAARQRNAAPEELPGGDAFRGAGSQIEVWRSVDQLQKLLSSNLATAVASDRSRTSLQLSLENETLKQALSAYVAALEPAGHEDADVVGVAVAIGGRIASADLYPSNGLFKKMWPKIVRAAATEAISLRARIPESAPPIDAVAAFLAAAEQGRRSERAIGALATIETVESDRVLSVRALAPQGDLVHRSYLAK